MEHYILCSYMHNAATFEPTHPAGRKGASSLKRLHRSLREVSGSKERGLSVWPLFFTAQCKKEDSLQLTNDTFPRGYFYFFYYHNESLEVILERLPR